LHHGEKYIYFGVPVLACLKGLLIPDSSCAVMNMRAISYTETSVYPPYESAPFTYSLHARG